MKSWRHPEEMLATRAHLPHDINFEYIYDGDAGDSGKEAWRLKQELARERGETSRLKGLVKE